MTMCDVLKNPRLMQRKATRIVGGQLAPRNVANRHVVVLPFFKENQVGNSCGGSIIDNRHVLTAAHCLVGDDRRLPEGVSLFVSVGSFPDATFAGVFVTTIYVHNEFRDVFRADIAILRSSQALFPISNNSRMLLSRAPQMQGNTALVAGFGATVSGSMTRSKSLFVTELQLPSRQNCLQSQHVFAARVNDTSHFCAAVSRVGDNGAYGDTCDGDSGGPMFLQTESGLQQIGITSWGSSPCATPGNVGWYTNISVYYDDIMQVLDGSNPTSWIVHS